MAVTNKESVWSTFEREWIDALSKLINDPKDAWEKVWNAYDNMNNLKDYWFDHVFVDRSGVVHISDDDRLEVGNDWFHVASFEAEIDSMYLLLTESWGLEKTCKPLTNADEFVAYLEKKRAYVWNSGEVRDVYNFLFGLIPLELDALPEFDKDKLMLVCGRFTSWNKYNFHLLTHLFEVLTTNDIDRWYGKVSSVEDIPILVNALDILDNVDASNDVTVQQVEDLTRAIIDCKTRIGMRFITEALVRGKAERAVERITRVHRVR